MFFYLISTALTLWYSIPSLVSSIILSTSSIDIIYYTMNNQSVKYVITSWFDQLTIYLINLSDESLASWITTGGNGSLLLLSDQSNSQVTHLVTFFMWLLK